MLTYLFGELREHRKRNYVSMFKLPKPKSKSSLPSVSQEELAAKAKAMMEYVKAQSLLKSTPLPPPVQEIAPAPAVKEEVKPGKKRGPKPKGDHVLSDVERNRRYRERKRKGLC
jgi:hypothetical protein